MDKTYYIDVREPIEYQSGHIKDAVNISLTELMQGKSEKLNKIPKKAHLVVYCRSGGRSSVAINILHSMGYNNLINGINQQHISSNNM